MDRAIIDLPTCLFGPLSSDWIINPRGKSAGDDTTGGGQVVYGNQPRWETTLKLSGFGRDRTLAWRAIQSRMRGRVNVLRVPICDFYRASLSEVGILQSDTDLLKSGGIPFGSWDVGEVKSGDLTGIYDAADVSLSRASTATYFDASGKMVTAAANELRIDHDPVSGDALGALIEGEAENILSDSSFNGADQTYGSYELGQAAGPDGMDTLALITTKATNGSLAKTASVPASDGLIRVGSGFVRKGTAAQIKIDCGYWGGSDGDYIVNSFYFDFDTLATSGSVGGIIDCGGGLYRIWTAMPNNDTDGDTVVQVVLSAVGDAGQTLYGGDLQIETVGSLTAGPSSYMPTTDGPVTRAADTLTLNASGGNDWTLTFDDGSTQEFNNWVGPLQLTRDVINRKYLKSFQTSLTTPDDGAESFFSDGTGFAYEPTIVAAQEYAVGLDTITIDTSSVNSALQAGQWFSYDDWPYRVTSIDGSGADTTISFEPPLRRAIPEGGELTLKATALMVFSTDLEGRQPLNLNRFGDTSVDLIEWINRP